MDFEIRVIRSDGVQCAHTYVSAVDKEELAHELVTVCQDAQMGDSDWLDNVFDDD